MAGTDVNARIQARVWERVHLRSDPWEGFSALVGASGTQVIATNPEAARRHREDSRPEAAPRQSALKPLLESDDR